MNVIEMISPQLAAIMPSQPQSRECNLWKASFSLEFGWGYNTILNRNSDILT